MTKNNPTIVNINDIEDIVIAKIQIDKDDPNVDGRSNLNEFMNKYCKLDYLLTNNVIYIPFNIIKLFNKNYLFYSPTNDDDIKKLLSYLKDIDYNINNLTNKTNIELLNDNIVQQTNKFYIIHNTQIYVK